MEDEKVEEVQAASSEERPLTKRERRQIAKQEKLQKREKSEQSGKIKKYLIWAVVLLVVVFGGYKIWQWINTPQGNSNTDNVLDVKSDDWIKGNSDAKVTIVEYADFECPACQIYATQVLPQIESNYGDKIRLVFRHFPLPQHKNAIDAAKAAEAAGKQGKFWEMDDLLYQKQSDWDSVSNMKEKMTEYAKSLNLNIDQFSSDYDSDAVAQSIKDNENEAYALRVKGTPTFFINGKEATVNNGYNDLKQAIDSALAN